MKQQNWAHDKRHLCLSVAFQQGAKQHDQEALWDDLVAWCLRRGVFLGGAPGHAFLLVTGTTPGLRVRLMCWLRGQTVLRNWELTPAALEMDSSVPLALGKRRAQRSLLSADDHNARLEAMAQFQQSLVEQLQQTVYALHALRRIPTGEPGKRGRASAPDRAAPAMPDRTGSQTGIQK
jgi:hypothetical protein